MDRRSPPTCGKDQCSMFRRFVFPLMWQPFAEPSATPQVSLIENETSKNPPTLINQRDDIPARSCM